MRTTKQPSWAATRIDAFPAAYRVMRLLGLDDESEEGRRVRRAIEDVIRESFGRQAAMAAACGALMRAREAGAPDAELERLSAAWRVAERAAVRMEVEPLDLKVVYGPALLPG